MSPLRLTRPLVWIDIESTGLSPWRDRLIEISLIKQFPDGGLERHTWRVNPGMPIPPGSTAVHQIRDEDVANAPTFADIAYELARWLEGSDFAGFGVARFDLQVLMAEFIRARVPFNVRGRSVLDAQIVFHMRERRDLSAASMFYLGRELMDAHRSVADVEAARAVLEAQLERYPDLPREARLLAEHIETEVLQWADSQGRLVWEQDEIVVGFGRHRGRTLREVVGDDREYLERLLDSDFAEDFKTIVSGALRDEYPSPPMNEGPGLDLPPK